MSVGDSILSTAMVYPFTAFCSARLAAITEAVTVVAMVVAWPAASSRCCSPGHAGTVR